VGYEGIPHFLFEAGGGVQLWAVNDIPRDIVLTAGVHYVFQDRIFGVLENVFFEYTNIFLFKSHAQYKVGLQVGL
jgi:hypothetical protein